MYFIIGGDDTPPMLIPVQSVFTSCDVLLGEGGGAFK